MSQSAWTPVPPDQAGWTPVPTQPVAAPAEKSLFQKAKDNFNANTRGAAPGDGAVLGAVKDFGAGVGDLVRSAYHPLRTAEAIITTADPAFAAMSHFAGDDTALHEVAAQPKGSVARTLGQIGGGILAGEAGGAVADAIAPTVRNAVSRAVLLGKTPAEAYESALKPSTTLSQPERTAIVQTGLKNAVPVSSGGVARIGALIDRLNQDIKAEIGADPTRPINPNAVATRADIAKAKFANQVNAQPDLNAIEASRQQFLTEQGAKPGTPAIPASPTGILDAQGNPIMKPGIPAKPPTPAPPMNADDAQAMKTGTYRVLKGKYGEQGSASVEAQKALARGLKEEIAAQFPEINDLNASESRLLDLQPVLERAVNRIGNHQLVGIGTPVAGAAAKAVTGSGAVGAVASVVKAVLDNPSVKSRLAISLSKGAKIPYAQAAARVAAYSSALASSDQGQLANSTGDSPNQLATPQP